VSLGPSVNTAAAEGNAFLSKDGLSLYFQSNRAGGFGGSDLYVSQRASTDAPWGVPVNLGATINSAGGDFAPGLSADGHLLFFASDRPGGSGLTDIYLSYRGDPQDDFGWSAPVALGPAVNTPAADQAPAFSQSAEKGRANLYFSSGPSLNTGQDIYYAAVSRNGETVGPAVLVAELSDPVANDARPAIRADGREIWFFSNRAGSLGNSDLWVSTRASVHHSWEPPSNPGSPLNTSALESQPSLSHDGRTLFFTSARPGSIGASQDLWMTTRTPSGH
jgi:Tol biopolymer transport system component